MESKEQLKMLISSWKLMDERECLTEKGKGYVEGLERAFALVSGDEQ